MMTHVEGIREPLYWCTMWMIARLPSIFLFATIMSEQVVGIRGLHPIHSPTTSKRMATHCVSDSRLYSTSSSNSDESSSTGEMCLPKLVVFDLDGCLWSPEMYELIYFMGNQGAPFTPCKQDKNVMRTVGGQPVKLLKDVREVMKEIYLEPKWRHVLVGISSRTNAPHWAKELLEKFLVSHDNGEFVLDDVFRNGPIEMRGDSKIQHFHRINQATNISFDDMVFFDNEYGNCESVADLGVTVGYCPGGVSKEIWQATLQAFSTKRGQLVQL